MLHSYVVYKKAQEIRADLQSMLPETSSSLLKLGGMCNSFKTGSQVCSKNQKVQGTTKTSFIADFFTNMRTAGLLKAESHLPSLGAVEGNEKEHF